MTIIEPYLIALLLVLLSLLLAFGLSQKTKKDKDPLKNFKK